MFDNQNASVGVTQSGKSGGDASGDVGAFSGAGASGGSGSSGGGGWWGGGGGAGVGIGIGEAGAGAGASQSGGDVSDNTSMGDVTINA